MEHLWYTSRNHFEKSTRYNPLTSYTTVRLQCSMQTASVYFPILCLVFVVTVCCGTPKLAMRRGRVLQHQSMMYGTYCHLNSRATTTGIPRRTAAPLPLPANYLLLPILLITSNITYYLPGITYYYLSLHYYITVYWRHDPGRRITHHISYGLVVNHNKSLLIDSILLIVDRDLSPGGGTASIYLWMLLIASMIDGRLHSSRDGLRGAQERAAPRTSCL